MSEEKDEGFRVIDRRSSAQPNEESSGETKDKTEQGEGFVMKEGETPGPDKVDFSTFVFSLATGALIHMGLTPDPLTQKTVKNLKLAKQNIEMLEMLQTKTKGNLTDDESQMLENLLTEVRLRFVEAAKSSS